MLKKNIIRIFTTVFALAIVLPFSANISVKPVSAETVNLSFPFDNEAEQGGLFTVSASSEIKWVNESGIGKDDNTALKVSHIEGASYTSADNAIKLTLAESLPAGGTYNISAWFYAPAEDNKTKGTMIGPGIVINGEYAGATGTDKFPADNGTLPAGEWKELNVTLPIRETPLSSIDFRLYTNDESTHPDVWLLDNITITQIGELAVVKVPEWDLTIGSIKDAFANYFTVGNIIEPNQTDDAATSAMFSYHYGIVTSENSMKPVYMTTGKGKYNFSNADKLVEWAAANNLKVHGHTLVWHSQSAPWLTNDSDGKTLTREEAKANMEEYINTVAGQYAGKVYSWDVVNEAFLSSLTNPTSDWKKVLRTGSGGSEGSQWYAAYANGADESKGEDGSDYIYDAFVLARLADPNAKLFYNDFNETEAGKREAIAMMVEDLNGKWKSDERNTQPDRPLIEGVGMQAHYWTGDLKAENVEASIKRFIEAGVDVGVTELDIPFGDWSNYKTRTTEPTEEELKLQADLYRQIFEIYIKYADNIDRVTFWGKADPQSWRSEGYPSIFDKFFTAKEAYWSIMNTVPDAPEADADETEQAPAEVSETQANNDVTESTTGNDDSVNANSSNTDNNSNGGLSGSTIIIIVIAAVVVVLGAFILLKRRK